MDYYKLSGFEVYNFLRKIDETEDLFEGSKFKYQREDLNEHLNLLYENLRYIEILKSQAGFLFSYFQLSNSKFIEVDNEYSATGRSIYEADHFDSIYQQLVDYLLIIRAEIDIIEDSTGLKYWKENPILKSRKSNTKEGHIKKEYTKEQIREKDILSLILKTSENELFPANNSAIGKAVAILTNDGFSAEQIRQDISGTYKPKGDIKLDAIIKLEKIIKSLKES